MSRRLSGHAPTALMIGGTVVAGIAALAWQAIAARALDGEDLVAVITCWIVAYLVSAAVVVPIEQLVTTRELASARTPVRAIAGFAAAWAVLAAIAGLAARERFLADNGRLVAVMVAIVPCFALLATARGQAAGTGRYARYGTITAADAILRAVACGVLAAVGSGSVGIALTVPLAALVAIPFLGAAQRQPGAARRVPAATSGRFLASSSGGALIGNAMLVAPPLVAGAAGADAATVAALGVSSTAFRAPLFLVVPLAARSLPPLLDRATNIGPAAITPIARRVLAGGLGLSLVTGAIAAVVGPTLLTTVFGDAADISASSAALLGAGSALAATNLILTQAVVAVRRAASLPACWALGLAVAAVTLLLPASATSRALIGFVAGEFAVAIALTAVASRPRASAVGPPPAQPSGEEAAGRVSERTT